MENWEAIEPNVWKPQNENDSVVGKLIEKKVGGKYESNIYKLEEQGKFFIIFGTTILDSRMSYVKIGDQIKIEYKGSKTNKKGQPVKIFKVYKEKVTSPFGNAFEGI